MVQEAGEAGLWNIYDSVELPLSLRSMPRFDSEPNAVHARIS